MRVLVAIPYFAPAYAFGGSVTVAETIVAGMLAAGHRVTVLTTDVGDERRRLPADTPAVPAGAEVVRLPNVSHRLAAGANVYLPRGARRWLAEHVAGFDVVLLQDLYSAVSVWAARAAERAGVPYVLQAHGTASPARERGRSVAKQAFLRLWGRRTIERATAVLHATAHEGEDYRRLGVDDGRLTWVGQPLDLSPPTGSGKAAEPTVAYVGRLHPIKGVESLIGVVAAARRQVPGVRLEIVGSGAERYVESLERLGRRRLGEAVRFHGFVAAPQRTMAYERAHVAAVLSRSEGLPMVALEAMSCGTPVLLSEGCHFPEAHDRAGLVAPDDEGARAAALIRMLTDDALRERLGAGARELARDFRPDAVMPRILAALERAAGRG